MTNSEHPASLWPDPDCLGAVTDLYQLTMMAGYVQSGMAAHHATFELFVRRLPPGRSYLVFAGLEQALLDLSRLAFSREQAEYLRSLPAFRHVAPGWFDRLSDLRFDGDVWAIPEGTVVFPGEPLVRIEAPLPVAQWVETYLIAALNYPTLVASKAARIVSVAQGKTCLDFGARRAHGPQAGLLAARAAYLAGFTGTSHVEAGRRLGIPIAGTMAHSWVQAFPSELEAFRAFARVFPESTTLLVDTYDTLEGIRLAASVEPPVQAVRIDSGDLASLSRSARAILDAHGRGSTRILVSGDLDEWQIQKLLEQGAPIDGFGVGTELVTSRDAPALSMVYKLVAIDGAGRFKRSPGKRTYPLAKQVHRDYDAEGRILRDHVTRHDEMAPGEPLLVCYMKNGQLATLPSLEEIRDRTRRDLARLPVRLRPLDAPSPSDLVTYSDSLESEADRLGVKL
jgi:nicotinate phosphoribosyltransferase